MSWMDFILDLAELTIWPLTLIVSLYLLRSPLSLLIPFAESLKYKDFELQFSQQLNAVSQEAHETINTFKGNNPEQELVNNAHHLPNHSILEAWSHLDLAARAQLLAHDTTIEIPEQQPYKFVGKTLLEKNIITAKQSKLFHELRKLRNKVAHAQGFEVNSVLAKQYIEVCFALARSIEH